MDTTSAVEERMPAYSRSAPDLVIKDECGEQKIFFNMDDSNPCGPPMAEDWFQQFATKPRQPCVYMENNHYQQPGIIITF